MTDAKGHIVVFDTEFTTWEGAWQRGWSAPGEYREIVQIGAVKLEADAAMAEIATLELLVRPRLNPVLSDYFVKLTGITQAEVDRRAIGFAEALATFAAFVGESTVAAYCFGSDADVLAENCRFNNLAFPFAGSLFQDAGPRICTHIGREWRTFYSSDLPEIMGFPRPGQAHHGLGDARCVAQALRIMAASD